MITISIYGLGLSLALMTGLWLVSLSIRNVAIIDIFWSLTILAIGWVYVLESELFALRQLLVFVFLHLWSIRLAFYLGRRSWGQPEDKRYRAMRDARGSRFRWTSLFIVFWLQAGLAWLVSLPLLFVFQANGPLDWIDVVAATLFLIGLFFEVIGDWQMHRFRSDPNSVGQVCDVGLWRYTRHPNYFGEALLWWGFWFFALGRSAPPWSVLSPLLLTFMLLRVSGVRLLEQSLVKEKPSYRDYVRRTPAFVPWIPVP
tara:strand:- start:609 stop:1379 length:771 start_codon:yes stop_codon:yes gene_type:complete